MTLVALYHATATDLVTLVMTIFQNLFSSSPSLKDDAKSKDAARREKVQTMPVKMNLEERMAFRREMLFEAVKGTLNTHSIAPNTYRFKVVRTDKRGHCYVVMFDMSPDFMASEHGQHGQLSKLAKILTANAQSRYGLVVGAVYWRVDETLAALVADWAQPTNAAPLAAPQNPLASLIGNDGPATAVELADFEAARQSATSDIKIGNRTYSSDLGALGGNPPHKT